MPTLSLLRHAEAEPGGGDNYERRLTARGRGDAESLATALATRKAPQIIFASAAPRARETAELIAAAWNPPASVFDFSRAFYAAEASDWMTQLSKLESETSALVVGHNPALGILAQRFLARAIALPAGGFLEFEIEGAWRDLAAARFRLAFVNYPPRFEARAPKIEE